MRSVRLMDSDSLLASWDQTKQMLKSALSYSWQHGDTMFDVVERLADGRADIVEVRQDGELLAVAVVETFDRKDGEWLNVWALAGDSMGDWIAELDAWLVDTARMRGLRGVMCGGRPGWEKTLARLGWSKRSVIMERSLCH